MQPDTRLAHRDAACSSVSVRSAIDLSRLYEFRSGIRIKMGTAAPTGYCGMRDPPRDLRRFLRRKEMHENFITKFIGGV